VLAQLGSSGHPETVSEATSRFDQHLAATKTLDADLRSAVSICVSVLLCESLLVTVSYC